MIPPILNYDSAQVAETLVDFTKRTLAQHGISKLVVGLSTGLDSTTAGYIATRAIGGDNLIAVHLPHHDYEARKNEFNRICELLQVPQHNRKFVDIMPMLEAYSEKGNVLQMTNLLTRVQRSVLFDYSHKERAPLYGTLNRTEYELGEFPIFGLDASFQPLRGLFKTQVRELAKCLGAPEDIQQRIPEIDTWQGKDFEIMRRELVRMGIPIVDQILAYAIEKKLSSTEIQNEGFKKEDVDFVLKVMQINAFKKELPFVPDLSKILSH